MTPARLKISTNNSQPPADVLVVGSVAYDDIITPYTTGERILGGAAAYAALAASYFAPTRIVGVVGNDFDQKHWDRLSNHGIDLEGMQVDESGPTFYWKGMYHENFNHRETLELELGVFSNFRPTLPEKYKETSFIMLGNIDPELQLHVLDQTLKHTFVLADTMDFWIETKRHEVRELIRKTDLFAINDSEAKMLTEENNLILAGYKIRDMGAKYVVVKKGEHGAYLFYPGGVFALPAYPITGIKDPTGAGDTFAGGLLGYLAAVQKTDLESIKQAMLYATATASVTVEDFSCDRLEHAGPQLIEERVQALREMVTF